MFYYVCKAKYLQKNAHSLEKDGITLIECQNFNDNCYYQRINESS